jgi:hypothetical protein
MARRPRTKRRLVQGKRLNHRRARARRAAVVLSREPETADGDGTGDRAPPEG